MSNDFVVENETKWFTSTYIEDYLDQGRVEKIHPPPQNQKFWAPLYRSVPIMQGLKNYIERTNKLGAQKYWL